MDTELAQDDVQGTLIGILDTALTQLRTLEGYLKAEAAVLEGALDTHNLSNMHSHLSRGLTLLAELPQCLQSVDDPLRDLVMPKATHLAEQARLAAQAIEKHQTDPIVFLPLMLLGGRAFPMNKVEEMRALVAG